MTNYKLQKDCLIKAVLFSLCLLVFRKNNTTFASHTIAELQKNWKNLLHTYKKRFLN